MAVTQEKVLNYLNLPEEYSSRENSKAVIIPVPYEAPTSYNKRIKGGPKAILSASLQVNLFDDELWTPPYKIGIQTLDDVAIEPVTAATKKPFQELYDVVSPLVEFGKFPIVIGGEHCVSLGAIRACADRFPDLSILQIDAHADLRKAHLGNPYNDESISFQIYKVLPQPLMTTVGVRSVSEEEIEWLEEAEPKINIFWARNQDTWNFHEIVHTLSDHVYLTIDVDVLDSGIMPSCSTPEPGGMNWYQLCELIKVLCIRKHVVAADIMELAPIKDFPSPDFLVAKLLYKLIGYRFAMELGVTKKYL